MEQQGYAWDRDICAGATLNDIDNGRVKAYLARARQARQIDLDPDTPIETALESLEVLKDGKPTNAAMLFFGRSPQKFINSAEIRCAKFRGDDVTQQYANMKVFGGSIVAQIDQTEAFIRDNIAKAAWLPKEKFEREESWEYPPDAFREAVINAVCHGTTSHPGTCRSASLQAPGDLESRIASADSHHRIAETAAQFKAEETAYSRDAVQDQIHRKVWLRYNKDDPRLRDLSVPEPEFREQDEDFMVTFRRSSVNVLLEQSRLLNGRQKQAIEYLKVNESITSAEFAELAGSAERTARLDLSKLVEWNAVGTRRRGRSPGIFCFLHSGISPLMGRNESGKQMQIVEF